MLAYRCSGCDAGGWSAEATFVLGVLAVALSLALRWWSGPAARGRASTVLALGGHGTIVAAVAWQGGGVGGVVLWAGVAATFFGLVLLVSVRLASRELSSADDIAWFRRGAVGLVAIGSTVMGLGFLLGGRFL